MIVEMIVTAFIAVYIGLVILGHGLLLLAILKVLDAGGGHRQQSIINERATDRAETPSEAVPTRSSALA